MSATNKHPAGPSIRTFVILEVSEAERRALQARSRREDALPLGLRPLRREQIYRSPTGATN